jgi:hypothetical protein
VESGQDRAEFYCSPRFILERDTPILVTTLPHIATASALRPRDIVEWLKGMGQLLFLVDHHGIVNRDDKVQRIIPSLLLTWEFVR